jgi:hypothetical protein
MLAKREFHRHDNYHKEVISYFNRPKTCGNKGKNKKQKHGKFNQQHTKKLQPS